MNGNVLIEVNGLKKHYNKGKVKALDGVNCVVHKGEVLVIIGPSGSGKSTLLRSLNLLEIPTEGNILFDGVDITDPKININTHRQKMGMVFQHFNLFPHMTVLRNMTIAPVKLLHKSKADAEKKAMELLTGRPGKCLSQPAFGRTETACCDCTGAVHGTGSHAV